jgi:hypothetical protein
MQVSAPAAVATLSGALAEAHMSDDLDSLRELVETRAVVHRIPRRRVWEWALAAILDGTLVYGLSDFDKQTWRPDSSLYKDLADMVRVKIRGVLPFLKYDWDPCAMWASLRRLRIAPAVFDEWLERQLPGRPKQDRPRGSRGPQKGTLNRYSDADRALFSEMEQLIRKQRSVHAAALHLALEGNVAGTGTLDSRARRLAKAYRDAAKTR